MPPKHDTWLPLYVGDYLRDTQKLQAEQHGAYLLLIMEAWTHGGSVSDDPEELATIARVPLERWQSHTAAKVLPFFRHCDGRYWHDRVLAELDRAKDNVAKKSKAGAAGAAARWQKDGSRMADAMPEQRQTDAPSPSPSPTDNPDGLSVGGAPKKRAAKKCPADFVLTDDLREWAVEHAPDVDPDKATEAFRDHTFRNAITDWPGAWRNWLRKDQEFAANRRGRVTTGQQAPKTFAELSADHARKTVAAFIGTAAPSAFDVGVIDVDDRDATPLLPGGEP